MTAGRTSDLRAAIRAAYLADEAEAVARLGETTGLDAAARASIPEGVALMCLAEARILEGLSNAKVAERVRERIPGAGTSPKSVAWHAAKMRRRGVEAPKRGRSR